MTLNKGLIGHWTMDTDDVSGSTLYDSSAFDNHGSMNGSIVEGVGARVNDGFSFGGLNSGDWIDINGLSEPISGAYSASIWVRPTALNVDTNNNYRNVLSGGDNKNIILIEQGGNISFRPTGNGDNFTAGNASLDQWTHIVCVWNGSDRIIYQDGVEQGRETITASPSITDIAISESGGGHQFAGGMDDLRIWNRAVTAEEVAQLYQIRNKRSQNLNPNTSGPKAGDATNLMDWSDWAIGNSGSFGNWSANGTNSENEVIAERHPYDEGSPVWYAHSEDTTSDSDGGWNYNVPVSEIDNSKKYRYTVWAKDEFTSGTVYHGTDRDNGNVEDFAGNVQSNPYFWSGSLPRQGEWFLIVGYIHPAGASSASEGEIYDMDGNTYSDSKNITDYRWVSSLSNHCKNRSYYYDTNVGRGAYFADPRFEAVDGSERSLSDILNRAAYRDQLKKGLVGNFFIGNNNVSGSDFVDKSSQQNNATGSGTPVTASGNLYQALDADGAGSVSWDSAPFRSAVQNGEWTITLWVKQDTHTSGVRWIDLIRWGGTNQRFERGYADTNTDQDYWCNLGDSANPLSVYSAGVSDNTWWHCTIRVSQSENVFEMYVNGSVNQSRAPADFVDPGVLTINPSEYGGNIEDLRFYKRALTQDEIQALYDRGV